MEIQEREESNLYEKLESEEFSCDRRKLIRKIEEILWEWNQKEQRQQKRQIQHFLVFGRNAEAVSLFQTAEILCRAFQQKCRQSRKTCL